MSRRIMRKGVEVVVDSVTEENGGLRASLTGDRLFRMVSRPYMTEPTRES